MQKISVSGPAELATIVPFHLGFQPERSVVVICLQDRAVGLVARVDVVGRPHAAETAARLTETIRRDGTTAVALVSALAAAIGYATLDGASPNLLGGIQAFAAGAILTMLADTMIPEATENGGAAVGLVTVLGFALAFLLSTTS